MGEVHVAAGFGAPPSGRGGGELSGTAAESSPCGAPSAEGRVASVPEPPSFKVPGPPPLLPPHAAKGRSHALATAHVRPKRLARIIRASYPILRRERCSTSNASRYRFIDN